MLCCLVRIVAINYFTAFSFFVYYTHTHTHTHIAPPTRSTPPTAEGLLSIIHPIAGRWEEFGKALDIDEDSLDDFFPN